MALFSVLLSIVSISCSSGSDAKDEDQLDAFARAELEIVYAAYEQGRLGTTDEVKADMEPFFNKPGRSSEPKPFEGSRLIPFKEMNERQQVFFSMWYQHSENVSETVGPEILAAKEKLLREQDRKSSK
jgi:hypothetical protein